MFTFINSLYGHALGVEPISSVPPLGTETWARNNHYFPVPVF